MSFYWHLSWPDFCYFPEYCYCFLFISDPVHTQEETKKCPAKIISKTFEVASDVVSQSILHDSGPLTQEKQDSQPSSEPNSTPPSQNNSSSSLPSSSASQRENEDEENNNRGEKEKGTDIRGEKEKGTDTRGEKEKGTENVDTSENVTEIQPLQHVQVSHTLDVRENVSNESPPIGPDGLPIRTSVCLEIEQSVQKAEDIERKLANSKVFQ